MLNWDEYGKEENNVPQVTAEVKTNESIQETESKQSKEAIKTEKAEPIIRGAIHIAGT